YISALTQLKMDRLDRVATSDTRLLRRIVRDARARGYCADETIAHWENVRRGEDRNIFPYQEQADLMKARRALAANENFIRAMRSAFEAAVKQAVQDGVITQAQADLILQRVSSQAGPHGFLFGFPPFEPDEGGPVPPPQTP
ncbi:MAG: hypothetical protein ACK44E_07685, partial [Anaerolineales bacterium]